MCEDRLTKYQDCDPDPEMFESITLEGCIGYQSDFDDPCFAEEDEFFRCRVERLSCDDYFDIDIDTRPGSPCFEFLVMTNECRLRHR